MTFRGLCCGMVSFQGSEDCHVPEMIHLTFHILGSSATLSIILKEISLTTSNAEVKDEASSEHLQERSQPMLPKLENRGWSCPSISV